MLTYQTTPVQEIHDRILSRAQVRLFVKREDLNHPVVNGNKWWKLKYNLIKAVQEGKKTILTFGGAYSNHIYAAAAAAHELGIQSIGIIRGEETLPLNDTLQFARQMDMRLYYVSRTAYREKTDPAFIIQLENEFGDFFLIPEGGSNELAIKGVQEFTNNLDLPADYVCCPVGTGGTLAGIIRGLNGERRLIGFSALKDGAFLNKVVQGLVNRSYSNWEIITEYHFGGYAKSTTILNQFIDNFMTLHHIPLEFIYTGKMMYGIFDLASKGYFEKGSSVLAIHTGGIRPSSSPFLS